MSVRPLVVHNVSDNYLFILHMLIGRYVDKTPIDIGFTRSKLKVTSVLF